MTKVKIIIGLILVVMCLYLLKHFTRNSSVVNLLNAGATKVSMFPELQMQEPLGLAAISPARYENRIRVLLKGDGIFVAFKDEKEAYYFPVSLITLTGKSWLHSPLIFGQGKCKVELDLGCEVTEAIKRMKNQTDIQPVGVPNANTRR